MHCTQCGAEGHGRFCAECGAPLESVKCRGCGAELPPGTRFCTQCGTSTAGGVSGGGGGAKAAASGAPEGEASSGQPGQNAGWWIAGGLLAVLLVIGGIIVFDGPAPEAAAPAPTAAAPFAGSGATGGGTPSGGTPPDLSTMTPREAADRLFNRVMQAAANDNTAEADQFLPMALDAYELARPLDPDGHFHVSLLQRAAGELEASLETATQGLDANPNHLLNLYSAAEAAIRLGDAVAGLEYYERLLEVWDEELAAERVEYDVHSDLLPTIREEAEAFLSGGEAP